MSTGIRTEWRGGNFEEDSERTDLGIFILEIWNDPRPRRAHPRPCKAVIEVPESDIVELSSRSISQSPPHLSHVASIPGIPLHVDGSETTGLHTNRLDPSIHLSYFIPVARGCFESYCVGEKKSCHEVWHGLWFSCGRIPAQAKILIMKEQLGSLYPPAQYYLPSLGCSPSPDELLWTECRELRYLGFTRTHFGTWIRIYVHLKYILLGFQQS